MMGGGPVLVTGGARRLGAVIARHLASEGWAVAIHCHHSRAEAEQVAADIVANGGTAVVLEGDLADAAFARGLVDAAAAALGGPLDGLVNNAALFEPDDILDFSPEALEAHHRVNLAAPLLLSAAFARQAVGPDRASIVQLLDQKLANPNPDFPSYTASKAALSGMIAPMAMGYKGRCRVNGVAPGILYPSFDQTAEEYAEVRALNLSGRAIDPEDVARTVAFLLDCPAINGQTVYADNGQHLVASSRDVMFLNRERS